jgi:hypothetical protein
MHDAVLSGIRDVGKGQKAFGTILTNEKQWVGALPCHFCGCVQSSGTY